MSTYVPGVETYLPDIKPFTPDSKFLSSALQTRQDKYNRNWSTANSLYNKIVYAPLSREDNLDKRNQYIEQIQPALEKISGMDLSIAQNINSAKSVFAPFYEDELLVKDMMYTTNYQNQMGYANRLFESIDKDQQSKWWETGVKDLQYKMQDFQNASGNAALNMGLPRYVEDVNLYQAAEKYLSELDPPLKIELPINLNSNDDYIITQQNGDLVTGQALEAIKNRFINDPMIQRAYYTEAFVKGRNFADQGVKSGEFSSVKEGQEIWAQQTIDIITKQNDFYKDKATKALRRESQVVDNWEVYRQNNGIIPGSQDEKVMKEQYDSYEATKSSLESLRNIKDVSKTPVKDLNGTLQKAYQLILMNGIGSDLTKAAKDFSMRDYSVDYKVNTIKRDKLKFKRQQDLIYLKNSLDRKLAEDKGELVDTEYLKFVNETQVQLGGPTGILGSVDKDNKVIQRDKYVENLQVYKETENVIKTETIDLIIEAKKIFNPTGDEGEYTITLDNGTTYSGGISDIKEKLSERDKVTGDYVNINAIQNELDKYAEFTKEDKDNISEASKQFPSKIGTSGYINFFNEVHGVNSLPNRSAQNVLIYNKANEQLQKLNKDIIDQAINSNDESKVSKLIKSGYPSTINENGKLSLEEYKNKAVELARSKQLKKPNGDALYPIVTKTMYRKEMDVVRSVFNSKTPYFIEDGVTSPYNITGIKYTTENTGRPAVQKIRGNSIGLLPHVKREISVSEVRDEAEKAYNILNNNLMSNPLYKEIPSLMDARRGRSETDDDVSVSNDYKTTINPAVMNPYSKKAYAEYTVQKRSLVGQGSNYGIIIGDTPSSKDDYLIKDMSAVKLLKLIDDETMYFLNTPKASRTSLAKVPVFDIVQKPTFGVVTELVKNQAATTIVPNERWLKSFQKGSVEGVETGIFTNDEINSIIDKGGVTLIYDKNLDVSSKATKQIYYSPMISEVEISPYNFVQKTIPGIDSIPTGVYSVTKEGNDNYYITYSFNQYQEGGTYRSTPEYTKNVDNRGKSDVSLRFDKNMDIIIAGFDEQRRINSQRKAKDVKLNGSK